MQDKKEKKSEILVAIDFFFFFNPKEKWVGRKSVGQMDWTPICSPADHGTLVRRTKGVV